MLCLRVIVHPTHHEGRFGHGAQISIGSTVRSPPASPVLTVSRGSISSTWVSSLVLTRQQRDLLGEIDSVVHADMIPDVDMLATYPRIRFMGSKHRLAPRLAELFATLPPGPAIDAFSGSGVVAYALKATGRETLANDHLTFTATLAEALVANGHETLSADEVETLCSPNRDGRAFIATTFEGRYFPDADHAFLDAAWSHVDELQGAKRALALSALCLAAAWKQPRGVFTVTTPRYDDGRRQLHTPLEDLFKEAVTRCNAAVRPGEATATCGDVFAVDPARAAIAYLDPPYAPPRDDTCYVKRYHFLEGLATYWRGQEIMWETRTRKLRKRHTPFGSKRTVRDALDRLFEHFHEPQALVVSYGSNAELDAAELEALLARHRRNVRRIEIPHRYAFGTHRAATRRLASEWVFVAM
jgi:adenine-specific DNA-methyltransferase